MREYIFRRDTNETKILVDVGLDEYSEPKLILPNDFLKHMLYVFSFHSAFKIEVEAESLDNDPHHLVEDIAITLGMAFKNTLGDKRGINRYGWSTIPMDEALVMSSIDLSGRPYCDIDLKFTNSMINDLPVNLITHFFTSFAHNAMATIHIKQINGKDDHHIAEAAFKSFAHSMATACALSNKYSSQTPSSKGLI